MSQDCFSGVVHMAATTASVGPRYAPEDPSLPKPWKALVDGNTGYLYFWNPETNVTQYERPTPPPESMAKVSSNPKASVVQGPSQVRRDYASNEEGNIYGRFDNGVGSRVNQVCWLLQHISETFLTKKVIRHVHMLQMQLICL